MPRTLYCWRCKMDIPMLDEQEWHEVAPLLRIRPEDIGARRQGALDRYYAITGFRETEPNAIHHHRIRLYGPPCEACGKPLRTPRAKWCAACGADADQATASARYRSFLTEGENSRRKKVNAEMEPPPVYTAWSSPTHGIAPNKVGTTGRHKAAEFRNSLIKDKDWSIVADRICGVTRFSPHARVIGEDVIHLDKSKPLAFISLECRERGVELPPNTVGAIFHKEDFKHLWSIFAERGFAEDEKVCIVWSKRNLRAPARLFSVFMPRLAVMVFKNRSYEMLANPEFYPHVVGQSRLEAELPICLLQPEIWKEPILPTLASL